MTVEEINQKAVKASIIFGFIIAIIGMTVGFLVSSQAIFFAAIASLIGSIITLIPLAILKFINKKDAHKYPFGKETLEPFIAFTQYFPLLIICVYNIFTAVRVIFDGGNMVNVTSGMLYGLFSTTFKISACGYLIYLTKKHSSPIAEAEVLGWKFESAIGIGILAGFSLAWLLKRISLTAFIPYVDPILTLIIFLIFIVITIIASIDCMRELMQSRPSESIVSVITEKIKEMDGDYDFSDKVLRLGKVGSKVIVEIDYIVMKDSKLDSISVQDQLRGRFTQAFAELPYRLWINISFTSDIKWTEHIISQQS